MLLDVCKRVMLVMVAVRGDDERGEQSGVLLTRAVLCKSDRRIRRNAMIGERRQTGRRAFDTGSVSKLTPSTYIPISQAYDEKGQY